MDKSDDEILQLHSQPDNMRTELGYNGEDKSTLLGIAGNVSEFLVNQDNGVS